MGEYMKRRVVKHGPVTLIISLPSGWVKRQGIMSGDEIDVEEQADGLLIRSDTKSEELIAEFETTSLDRTTLMYTIRGYYRLGYDSLTIIFASSGIKYGAKGTELPVIDVIREEVARLIGYEIVHEEEGMCTIRDLQSPSMKDFDAVLRRVLLLVSDAARELSQGVGNKSRLATINHKHDTITKFVSYCLRMLSKKSSPDISSKYLFHVIASLDRLTDLIKYAARDLYDKPKISMQLKKILEINAESMTDYASVHYKYDAEKVRHIDEGRYLIIKQLATIKDESECVVATRMLIFSEMLLDFIESLSVMKK